jgi:hypothetical protein
MRLQAELKLRPGQLEELLYLDRLEHLRLERVGARPHPAEVASRYNFQVLECLLRHAELVELVLNGPLAEQADAVVAIAGAHQVDTVLERAGARLCLLGRQDALGGWGRHGRRLVRSVLDVLDRARGLVVEGTAHLSIRGRRGRLRLAADLLDMLAGPAGASLEGEPDDLSRILRTCSDTLRAWGWRVRVRPEPYVGAQGVVLPDLLVQRTPETAPCLLVAVRGPHHARRLARLARAATSGETLVWVGRDIDLSELRAGAGPVLAVAGAHDALPSRSHLARLLRDQLLGTAAQAA